MNKQQTPKIVKAGTLGLNNHDKRAVFAKAVRAMKVGDAIVRPAHERTGLQQRAVFAVSGHKFSVRRLDTDTVALIRVK